MVFVYRIANFKTRATLLDPFGFPPAICIHQSLDSADAITLRNYSRLRDHFRRQFGNRLLFVFIRQVSQFFDNLLLDEPEF